MNDTASFAVFDRFLRRLGFIEQHIPGSHVYYEHPDSGTVVMARLHQPKDVVPWHTFASTRKILIERGLVTPERFARLTGAAAGIGNRNGRRSARAPRRHAHSAKQ